MPTVEVLEVWREAPDQTLFWGANLDEPNVGVVSERYRVLINGWALGREQPVERLVVYLGKYQVATAQLDTPRPDVQAAFPHVPNAEQSGYRLFLDVITLPPHCPLRLCVEFADGTESLVAYITLRVTPFSLGVDFPLKPLMVTALGRSGTTILMHYLGHHPRIVMYRGYPYELQNLLYYMRAFRVLTGSADWTNSMGVKDLYTEKPWIGANPYINPSYGSEVDSAYDFGQISRAAQYVTGSVMDFYVKLAQLQGREALVFAEKVSSKIDSVYTLTLFPNALSILLVRDPRDRYCSVHSFNKKRGYAGFGVEHHETEGDYLQLVRRYMVEHLQILEQFGDRVMLVRYEELVFNPQAVLKRIFDFAGIPLSEADLAQLLNASQVDDPLLEGHKTVKDPRRSIGRWKAELSPEQVALFTEIMGDVIMSYGYEI